MAGVVDVQFIGIRQAIAVGVLVAINDSVSIRIVVQRVGSHNVHFDSITQLIQVTVWRLGVGLVSVAFICVAQPVGVGVFVAVHDPIPVGIVIQRVGAQHEHFIAILQPVKIRVGLERVGL